MFKIIASNVSILLMTITFILLILKRRKLGKGINIFISAIGVGLIIEFINLIFLKIEESYNVIPVYVIGVNLIVFFLFFLYFHQLLDTKIAKKINMVFISMFFCVFLISAFFIKDYFAVFPFFSYCMNTALLLGSIYLILSQTFNSDKVLVLKNYYPFWICIGLMVIYLGLMPLLITSHIAAKIMRVDIFFLILIIVNVLGYSTLIYGIFCAKDIEAIKNEL